MTRSLLFVAPYLPWPADFGGAIRIYEFIRHLARSQHVILLAPATSDDIEAIEHLGGICDVTAVPVPWTFRQPAGMRKRMTQMRSMAIRTSFVEAASYDPRFQAVMDRLFMTRQIDLVQYEFPQMALYRPLRPCPTVLDNHNVEHELLRRVAGSTDSLSQRAFNAGEWRKVRRLERLVWSTVTLNITTSERDAEHVSQSTGESALVVPNGVDVGSYAAARAMDREPGRVVFVGAMRHQPNADGARWYAEHVHPLVVQAVPETTFHIVGADPPADVVSIAGGSVHVTGRVDSVVPFLGQASVAVVPLRSGGGTRLKILEAFAANVPVVSTTAGTEGLDVTHGTHLSVADSPQEFADAVIRLLRHDDRAVVAGTSKALELVTAEYDWGTSVVPRLIAAQDEAIARFDHEQ